MDFDIESCPQHIPQWLKGKESTCSAGDTGNSGLTPGSGRSHGGGHSSTVQYSYWKFPWTEEPGGLVQRIEKSWTWLSHTRVYVSHTSRLSQKYLPLPTTHCHSTLSPDPVTGNNRCGSHPIFFSFP